MTGLRAFSGTNPRCPKCRYIGITTAYHAPDGAGCRSGGSSAEHLYRTCDGRVGCGFVWAEACADVGATPPGAGKLRMALPPFSGRSTHCPKCKNSSVKTKYRAAGDDGAAAGEAGEHMARTCGDCGYVWAEACADAAEVPASLRTRGDGD